MVMYDYKSDEILSEPIIYSQVAPIRDAFLKFHSIIKSRGSDQKLVIMDNECSSDTKEAMKKYQIEF